MKNIQLYISTRSNYRVTINNMYIFLCMDNHCNTNNIEIYHILNPFDMIISYEPRINYRVGSYADLKQFKFGDRKKLVFDYGLIHVNSEGVLITASVKLNN